MKLQLLLIALILTFLTLTVIVSNHKPAPSSVDQTLAIYMNRLYSYWPPAAMASNLGIAPYAKNTAYNVYILTFWLSTGASDTALVWQDAMTFFSVENPWGATNKQEIQTAILKAYHDEGAKLLASAFGATEFPASAGADPVSTCDRLADWVLENNLDGVDLDFEDNDAMEAGTGEEWIIKCTKTLRKKLPVGKYILTHAPQAPYFTDTGYYKNGGYLEVDRQIGHLIDWYNVQFYNQGPYTQYNTYKGLYIESGGDWLHTAVKEIIDNGVDAKKIVVGKPVGRGDAMNTGWISPSDFGVWARRAYDEFGFHAGMMGWQYSSDLQGDYINSYLAYFQ